VHRDHEASQRAFAAAGFVTEGDDGAYRVLRRPVCEPITTV
jgi:hypothetical protein